ncbi:MAG: hypothetical protein AAGA65_25860 [Actinomycetota bacterium]
MSLLRKAAAAVLVLLLGATTLVVTPADASPRIRFTSAGDLTVLGTNGGDNVVIGPVSPGVWEVVVTSDTGVTVQQQFTRPPRNITVNTRGNDDRVVIDDLDDNIRNLTVNLGAGFDQTELARLRLDGNLKVIATGAGGNELKVENVVIDRRTTISLGSGHHIVDVDSVFFRDNFRLTTAATGRLDYTSVFSAYRGRLDMRTGNGPDLLVWNTQNFFGGDAARINTRGGNDDVQFKFDHFSDADISVRLGSGDDEASLIFAHLDGRFDVFGEAGNDRVDTEDSNYAELARFNGGSGTNDLYREVDSTFAVGPDIIGFESTFT